MTALKGARILVTRPTHQAENLCELIRQAGGEAIRFPTLEILAVQPPAERLAIIPGYDWLIFISANAVNFALQAINGKMPQASAQRIAAVGKATAKALQQAGLQVDCIAESGFTSEALLALPEMTTIYGKRCLIVRGRGGREQLAEVLTSRGASVEYLEVYQRQRPEVDAKPIESLLANGELSAVTITSGEALSNLLLMLDSKSVVSLQALPLLVISNRLAQQAQQQGFSCIKITAEPADKAILKTLIDVMNGDDSDRSN